MSVDPVADLLSLLDWKQRIAELYGEIRATPVSREARTLWQQTRTRLFREHPQSPFRSHNRRTITAHTYATMTRLGGWPVRWIQLR